MKIAITADVHLTDKAKHAPRANALRNILVQCKQLDVGALIIAGDLFDKDTSNPAILESIVREEMPLPFKITILPGNHDHRLNNDLFSDQLPINVIEETTLNTTDFGVDVLMVPYGLDRRLGTEISHFKEKIAANKYLLISHGDHPVSLSSKNEYEDGVYMPLYKRDLIEYSPKQVFLGHIHIAESKDNVHYTGSPCGLDITETGERSFILYDTSTNVVERVPINTDIIYFNESFTLIPGEREEQQLLDQVETIKLKWDKLAHKNARVSVRMTVHGYSNDRGAIEGKLRAALANAFENLEEPDINIAGLTAFSNPALDQTVAAVKQSLDDLVLARSELLPDKDLILRESLKILFGGK